MSVTREEAIERLLAHYQEPYRCAERPAAASPELAATAFMHLVSDRKILSLATVGIVESDDFVYIYSVEELTPEVFDRCCTAALTDALKRVDPNPNHNFSLVSVFFICDKVAPETTAAVKKMKYHKDYENPEHGWVDLRLAAVEVGGGTRCANPMGKVLLNIYKASVN